jgi:hypothetical protein
MSSTSGWLADHVASLLPKTVASVLPQATAGACVPPDQWVSRRTTCNGFGYCCDSSRACHYSCYGHAICGSWRKYYCW